MNKRFLLLNPLQPKDFHMTEDSSLAEALEEFGCKVLTSTNLKAEPVYFAYADTQAALEQMCETVDLDGTVIEMGHIYDQLIQYRTYSSD